jgi:membrane-associated phospholipid phosphatase
MKKILFIIIISFIFISFALADNTSDKKTKFKLDKNSIVFKTEIEKVHVWQEIAEWSTITNLAIVDFSLINGLEPLKHADIFPNLDTDKEMNTEIMPTWLGIIGFGLVESLILFLPNNEGFLNYEAYINVKGFAEAFTATMFIVDILKFTVAEKRPNYQTRLATGNAETIADGQKSFPSLHAAIAFSATTYLTFFMFQYLGDNRIPSVLGLKIAGALFLNSFSFLIAALRVIKNEHYVHDVVVGGVIGMLISSFFFCMQNYFGIYKKKISKNIIDVEPDKKELGLNLVYKF